MGMEASSTHTHYDSSSERVVLVLKAWHGRGTAWPSMGPHDLASSAMHCSADGAIEKKNSISICRDAESPSLQQMDGIGGWSDSDALFVSGRKGEKRVSDGCRRRKTVSIEARQARSRPPTTTPTPTATQAAAAAAAAAVENKKQSRGRRLFLYQSEGESTRVAT